MASRRGWNKDGGVFLRLILPVVSFAASCLILVAVMSSVKGEVLDLIARLFGTF